MNAELASEGVDERGDVSAELSRGSTKQCAGAGAERAETGLSFLAETNERLAGRTIDQLADDLDLHRAGPKASPVERRLRAGIKLRQPRANDERSARLFSATATSCLPGQPLDELWFHVSERLLHGGDSVRLSRRQAHAVDVEGLDRDGVVIGGAERLEDARFIDAMPVAVGYYG